MGIEDGSRPPARSTVWESAEPALPAAAPASDQELINDPFWGVSQAAPVEIPFSEPDRNADLLR